MAVRSGIGEGGTSNVQTGILLGQIAAVLGVTLGGVWGATQWTAHALGYQPRLRSAWSDVAGLPIYAPWKLFEWWYWYDAYAPGIFLRGGTIAAGSGLLATGVAIGMAIWRSRVSRSVTTYGSARWAEADGIRKAGLHEAAGVLLGRQDDRYLRHAGPEHVMAFAPTRSGKGVGLVVPTLLSWPDSAVIHDIKGENWALTAGWRARFSRCLLFNPTEAKSAAYNPLLEVHKGMHESGLMSITGIPDGEAGEGPQKVGVALQGCDLRFVVSHNSGLGFLVAEFAAIELRQPYLDEIG